MSEEKINQTVLSVPGEGDFFTEEAYKALRTNLQFCGQNIKVIAVTSFGENEGKTTVSLQLGRSFSELGKKVIVIDADMRKSVMAIRNTTAKSVSGLSEVLNGMKTLDECLYWTQYEGLALLFAGMNPPNPVELLGSQYFADLLTTVREKFDYVIIDTPPVGLVIDAAVVAPVCDGCIFVWGRDDIKYRQASKMIDQMSKTGCRVLGVVRNKFRRKGSSYYGYYGKSKYGYGQEKKPAAKDGGQVADAESQS